MLLNNLDTLIKDVLLVYNFVHFLVILFNLSRQEHIHCREDLEVQKVFNHRTTLRSRESHKRSENSTAKYNNLAKCFVVNFKDILFERILIIAIICRLIY